MEVLENNADFDIVIAGGGLAGLACGYKLLMQGKKVCILEAATVGSGETARSSAMVTFAHDCVYARLIKKHGLKTAQEFLRLQKLGAEKLKQTIEDNKIDCEYMQADFTLYAATKKGAKRIRQEQQAYEELKEPYITRAVYELPLNDIEQLTILRQACLNPAKFIVGFAKVFKSKDGVILENTQVNTSPQKYCIEVNGQKINFKHFIITSHYPYVNILPGFYFLKLYQNRNHNIVFKNARTIKNMYESADDEWYEFRPVKNGILCGGGAGRTGTGGYKSKFKEMEQFLKDNLGVDEGQILSRTSAQDVMTFDLMPYVGRYSTMWDNVYVVTGFNKWGFTNAFAASEIIADLIEGRIKDSIFSPQRASLLKAPVKAAKNLGDIVTGFGELLLNTESKKLKRIGSGQGAIVKVKNAKGLAGLFTKSARVGVYRDGKNKLHCVSAVCPHMGCALSWNKDELSWDCRCHGSRFDTDGKLLNNPATENLEKKNI